MPSYGGNVNPIGIRSCCYQGKRAAETWCPTTRDSIRSILVSSIFLMFTVLNYPLMMGV